MPGLVGIISRASLEKNKEDLSVMVDTMKHETFYHSGTYHNDQLGIYAGWVVHKDSFSDCMPVMNPSKDVVLLFSGENFADRETLNKTNNGYQTSDFSRATYLINQYEADEEVFLKNLNGWFCGIIIDYRKNRLILFNDRYAMQKIYYHFNEDRFIFASEAKALLNISPELRQLSPKSLGEFFACSCVLENRTLFPQIMLLPGASVWTFRNAKIIKKEKYFKPSEWENQKPITKEKFYYELRKTFSDILPRYFAEEEKIGMSLTGGLDTRMILSCIDISDKPISCYTFGHMLRDTFDVSISRKVAGVCKRPYHVIKLEKGYLSQFPDYAEKTVYVTDGCLDVYGAHSQFFNQIAREVAPIRMTGTFGGEVLRSVSGLKPVFPEISLFHQDFRQYLEKGRTALGKLSQGSKLSFILFKEAPWRINGIITSEQSQLIYRTPYMDNDFVKLVYQAPANVLSTNDISLRLISDNHRRLANIITDEGLSRNTGFLLSPWVQLYFSLTFKAEWYYILGMPHWVDRLVHRMSPLNIGRFITGRHKFENYRIWFRDELSEYIKEILLDERTAARPYFNKAFLEKMVLDHVNGNKNYTMEINKVLTVELINRLLIEA